MDTEQKNILDGVIDLHVHTAPDVIHRTYNDLELTDAAVRAGARAIVIKGHHCGTVARASAAWRSWCAPSSGSVYSAPR